MAWPDPPFLSLCFLLNSGPSGSTSGHTWHPGPTGPLTYSFSSHSAGPAPPKLTDAKIWPSWSDRSSRAEVRVDTREGTYFHSKPQCNLWSRGLSSRDLSHSCIIHTHTHLHANTNMNEPDFHQCKCHSNMGTKQIFNIPLYLATLGFSRVGF